VGDDDENPLAAYQSPAEGPGRGGRRNRAGRARPASGEQDAARRGYRAWWWRARSLRRRPVRSRRPPWAPVRPPGRARSVTRPGPGESGRPGRGTG